MPTPNEKLAESLTILRDLQKDGRRVFQSDELSRTHRERLVKNGFLQEVMKGWLMSSGPGTRDGESTPWYSSFWEFCARYCNERFGRDWYLSPEQSVLLHAENTVIPSQVIVCSPHATNHAISLPFKTSLYNLRQPEMPEAADLSERDGLRLFSPAAALSKMSEGFFVRNPIETQVVLAGIVDASDILRILLNGGHSAFAGRRGGGVRRGGRRALAGAML